MIISHEHEFIFLKTRKTAGSSVEVFLGQVLGPDAIVTPIDPPPPGHQPRNHERYFNPLPELVRVLSTPKKPGALPMSRRLKRPLSDVKRKRAYYNHMDAQRIRDRVGRRVFDRYFKFCFERDPWEKVLSLYYFAIDSPLLETPGSFSDFVLNSRLPADFSFYSIDGATPAMDYIGRYEHLTEDLARVLAHVGIDRPVELSREKSDSRVAQQDRVEARFTPELDARIASRFAREIRLFGYRDRSVDDGETGPPREYDPRGLLTR
ncbi:MAG: hypothetical protein ACXVJ7_03255 [Acidimicrobiia bacterium]